MHHTSHSIVVSSVAAELISVDVRYVVRGAAAPADSRVEGAQVGRTMQRVTSAPLRASHEESLTSEIHSTSFGMIPLLES